jgi:uncharacterized protein (TIGR00266 family)
MKYDLQGTVLQILNIQLSPGETVYAESGRLLYMSDNVNMSTEMRGGLWRAIKRKFAGESFFMVNFTPKAGQGVIGFATEVPGKIIPLKLDPGQEIIAQKDAFICSENSVEFDGTFTKSIGAGFLGGEGLILIKIRGPGLAFFNVGGEVTEFTLKKGQKLRIDTGNLAMFDAGVKYSVERVKGVKNMIWGGEGLFLATLEGPGRAWIQSLSIHELANKIASYMPAQKGGRGTAGGLLAGAALGAMMGGKR